MSREAEPPRQCVPRQEPGNEFTSLRVYEFTSLRVYEFTSLRVYEFTRFVRQDDPHLVYPQPLVPWLRPWNALHPRLRLPSGRPLRVRKRSPPRVPMTVLCLPNTRQCERQSLQGSAFPGKSLGTRWTGGGAWGGEVVFSLAFSCS